MKLELSQKEVELIVNALGQIRYDQVYVILNKIQEQAIEQSKNVVAENETT